MKKEITHDEILSTINDVLKSVRDFAEETPTKDEMNREFSNIREEMATKKELQGVEKRLTDEIESVKLRQDNVIYRFELNDLTKRVERIEEKI